MKLRIHENSLRLRVNRPDVEALRRDGSIEHRLNVTAEAALVYRLEIDDCAVPEAALVAAEGGSMIIVRLPGPLAERWFDEREVAVTASVDIAGGAPLELLIEKDFACLIPRDGEDSDTYFANPAKSQD